METLCIKWLIVLDILGRYIQTSCVCVSDKSMEVSFDEDAYYDRLGTRPAVDLEALGSSYRRMVELFYLCTEENPKKRPSAARILQALESNGPLNNTPSEVIVID